MPAPQYQPGQVLPGTVYRVVRHLATGGMGSVYEVEDTTVEKRYVLKTLHPNLIAREDLAARMRDEAKSLARLSHPNIVDVVTAGVTTEPNPLPFYVMERLVGQNLRVVLDKTGVLQPAHAYRIAIEVADALEHAHERHVVHRDVKPENIFLHRSANGTTTTKLLDFGIVRLLDRKESKTHGKFIGTLRYASPEQIVGDKLGPATDLYSLGIVLFEMLSGRGPFDEAGDAYAIGAAHAKTPAPRLSQFVRGLSPDVERLVASALAKSPAERPRDAFAFASELRRILREEEATPRSATVVSLLTPAVGGGAATEAHAAATVTAAATVPGMIPPSVDDLASTELSTSEEAAPVSPVAPTVAADVGVTPKPTPAPVAAGRARAIDRDAPTRESAPLRDRPGSAPNGTEATESLLVEAPPRAYEPPRAPAPPPPAPAASARGGPVLLVAAAAVAAVLMVGGALVAVRRSRPTPSATVPAASLWGASSLAAPPSSSAPIAAVPAISSSVAPTPAPDPPVVSVRPSASGGAPASTSRAVPKPRATVSAPARAKDVPFDP